MAAGRKPTPIALHRIKGTFRSGRHGSAAKTRSLRGVPDCPEWISERAKEAWERVCGWLDVRGVLEKQHAIKLELVCLDYAEWRDLQDEIAQEGRTYTTTTPAGDTMIRPNPKVAMLCEVKRRLAAGLSDLGLDPVSQSKVTGVTEAENKDPWADL